jgi:hypothetical protein
MRTLSVCLALLAALLAAPSARATSSHQVTSITPIKENGVVVGARITTLLKPAGHKSVLVGLGRPHMNKNAHTPQTYLHVRDKSQGYIVQELGTVPVSGPTEHTFDVRFGHGNDLKPGDQIEVYSFWESNHLWGSNRHESIKEPVYTLPDK